VKKQFCKTESLDFNLRDFFDFSAGDNEIGGVPYFSFYSIFYFSTKSTPSFFSEIIKIK